MKDKIISGFVVQNLLNMGYLGVKVGYDVIKGKYVKERIDTGATYIDLDNIEEDIQKLLYPLGKYQYKNRDRYIYPYFYIGLISYKTS